MYYVSPIPSLDLNELQKICQNIGTVLRSKFESDLNRSEKAYTGKRSKFTQSHWKKKTKERQKKPEIK